MAKKFLKTYEAFMLNRKFKFEEEVIDPILELIRDNQEFLTKPENLPQLAKLGYMYNSLWYSGRVCWGSEGILLDPDVKKAIEEYDYEDEENSPYQFVSCEDNPKYKIEMCNPQNEDIENLIYDAWGMHVRDDMMEPSFEDFSKIVKEGVPLTELEKKELKINKTFEDWVEIKLDPTYKYKSLYPDRKSVADYLLCTIGTGNGWNKEGYIIEEAAGADQDKSLYGDWRNAKFSPEIKPVVDKILSMPEVKETLDAAHEHINSARRKRKEEEDNRWKDIFKNIANKSGKESAAEFSDDELDKIIKDLMSKSNVPSTKTSTGSEKPKYKQYYPISSSSKIYAILDKETKDRLGIKDFHKSYVDASIEICKDILEHESQERQENVKFAKKLLTKLGISDYSKEFPKTADKYELEQELKDILLDLTDHFNQSNIRDLRKGDYCFYLNDTKTNQYADNNYYLVVNIDGIAPKGLFNNIDCFKSTDIYQDLKQSIDRISNLDDIHQINIGVDNISPNGKLYIEFIANKDYVSNNQKKFDEYLISKGFQVGKNLTALELKDIILCCRKPIPLGDSHPSNKTGMDVFSNAHEVSIYDKSWNKIGSFNIDERGFNTLRITNLRDKKLSDWIKEEFNKMKLSDPEYGFYGIKADDRKYEGKRNLYAHDFFLWLKNNQ